MDEDFGAYDFGGYDTGWGGDYGSSFGGDYGYGYGGDYGYGAGADYGYGADSGFGGSTDYGWGSDYGYGSNYGGGTSYDDSAGMGYDTANAYDPYGGAYAEATDFNNGGTQVADANNGSTLSPIVDRSTQQFDDGTSLTTLTDADGKKTYYSSWTDTQVFDDGSKLKTTTQDWGYGLQYKDVTSVDSLESRIERGNEPGFIDPRTASPSDVETAQDIMDNYGKEIYDRGTFTRSDGSQSPNMFDNLNQFINDYWLNKSFFFDQDGSPPTQPYQGQDPNGNIG